MLSLPLLIQLDIQDLANLLLCKDSKGVTVLDSVELLGIFSHPKSIELVNKLLSKGQQFLLKDGDNSYFTPNPQDQAEKYLLPRTYPSNITRKAKSLAYDKFKECLKNQATMRDPGYIAEINRRKLSPEQLIELLGIQNEKENTLLHEMNRESYALLDGIANAIKDNNLEEGKRRELITRLQDCLAKQNKEKFKPFEAALRAPYAPYDLIVNLIISINEVYTLDLLQHAFTDRNDFLRIAGACENAEMEKKAVSLFNKKIYSSEMGHQSIKMPLGIQPCFLYNKSYFAKIFPVLKGLENKKLWNLLCIGDKPPLSDPEILELASDTIAEQGLKADSNKMRDHQIEHFKEITKGAEGGSLKFFPFVDSSLYDKEQKNIFYLIKSKKLITDEMTEARLRKQFVKWIDQEAENFPTDDLKKLSVSDFLKLLKLETSKGVKFNYLLRNKEILPLIAHFYSTTRVRESLKSLFELKDREGNTLYHYHCTEEVFYDLIDKMQFNSFDFLPQLTKLNSYNITPLRLLSEKIASLPSDCAFKLFQLLNRLNEVSNRAAILQDKDHLADLIRLFENAKQIHAYFAKQSVEAYVKQIKTQITENKSLRSGFSAPAITNWSSPPVLSQDSFLASMPIFMKLAIEDLAKLLSIDGEDKKPLLSSVKIAKIFVHSQAKPLVDKLYAYYKEQEKNSNSKKFVVKDNNGDFFFIPNPDSPEKKYPLPKVYKTTISQAVLEAMTDEEFIKNLKNKNTLLMRDPVCIHEINRRNWTDLADLAKVLQAQDAEGNTLLHLQISEECYALLDRFVKVIIDKSKGNARGPALNSLCKILNTKNARGEFKPFDLALRTPHAPYEKICNLFISFKNILAESNLRILLENSFTSMYDCLLMTLGCEKSGIRESAQDLFRQFTGRLFHAWYPLDGIPPFILYDKEEFVKILQLIKKLEFCNQVDLLCKGYKPPFSIPEIREASAVIKENGKNVIITLSKLFGEKAAYTRSVLNDQHADAKFFHILSREETEGAAHFYPDPKNKDQFYEFTSEKLREAKPKTKDELIAMIADNGSVEGVMEACKTRLPLEELIAFLCTSFNTKFYSGPVLLHPRLKPLFTVASEKKLATDQILNILYCRDNDQKIVLHHKDAFLLALPLLIQLDGQQCASLFSVKDAQGNTPLSSREMLKILFHSKAKELVNRWLNYYEEHLKKSIDQKFVLNDNGDFYFIPIPENQEEKYLLPKVYKSKIPWEQFKNMNHEEFVKQLKNKDTMGDSSCIDEIKRRNLSIDELLDCLSVQEDEENNTLLHLQMNEEFYAYALLDKCISAINKEDSKREELITRLKDILAKQNEERLKPFEAALRKPYAPYEEIVNFIISLDDEYGKDLLRVSFTDIKDFLLIAAGCDKDKRSEAVNWFNKKIVDNVISYEDRNLPPGIQPSSLYDAGDFKEILPVLKRAGNTEMWKVLCLGYKPPLSNPEILKLVSDMIADEAIRALDSKVSRKEVYFENVKKGETQGSLTFLPFADSEDDSKKKISFEITSKLLIDEKLVAQAKERAAKAERMEKIEKWIADEHGAIPWKELEALSDDEFMIALETNEESGKNYLFEKSKMNSRFVDLIKRQDKYLFKAIRYQNKENNNTFLHYHSTKEIYELIRDRSYGQGIVNCSPTLTGDGIPFLIKKNKDGDTPLHLASKNSEVSLALFKLFYTLEKEQINALTSEYPDLIAVLVENANKTVITEDDKKIVNNVIKENKDNESIAGEKPEKILRENFAKWIDAPADEKFPFPTEELKKLTIDQFLQVLGFKTNKQEEFNFLLRNKAILPLIGHFYINITGGTDKDRLVKLLKLKGNEGNTLFHYHYRQEEYFDLVISMKLDIEQQLTNLNDDKRKKTMPLELLGKDLLNLSSNSVLKLFQLLNNLDTIKTASILKNDESKNNFILLLDKAKQVSDLKAKQIIDAYVEKLKKQIKGLDLPGVYASDTPAVIETWFSQPAVQNKETPKPVEEKPKDQIEAAQQSQEKTKTGDDTQQTSLLLGQQSKLEGKQTPNQY